MKQLIILLVLLVPFGCKERAVRLQLPYEGDKLVLFGHVRAGDTVRIEVQKTYPPTGISTYIDGIADATVKLFDEHGFLETLGHMSKGIYASSSGRKWQQGGKYRIEVEAPGFPLTSTDLETMPAVPVVASYEFGRLLDSKLNPGIPSKELILNIQDNISEENYYMVDIRRSIGKDTFGVTVFDIDKPIDDFEDPCQFSYRGFVVNDLCSSNGIITLKKGLEINHPSYLDLDLTAQDRITVLIRQISKSYYEFCKTYYDESELMVAFKTPYPRYTNVTGGYGIFTGYYEIGKEFILSE